MTIRVSSYNSTGFAHNKRAFIWEILKDSDILFLQEHWLNHGNLDELDKVDKDFMCAPAGVSGMPVGELRGPWGAGGAEERSVPVSQLRHLHLRGGRHQQACG